MSDIQAYNRHINIVEAALESGRPDVAKRQLDFARKAAPKGFELELTRLGKTVDARLITQLTGQVRGPKDNLPGGVQWDAPKWAAASEPDVDIIVTPHGVVRVTPAPGPEKDRDHIFNKAARKHKQRA